MLPAELFPPLKYISCWSPATLHNFPLRPSSNRRLNPRRERATVRPSSTAADSSGLQEPGQEGPERCKDAEDALVAVLTTTLNFAGEKGTRSSLFRPGQFFLYCHLFHIWYDMPCSVQSCQDRSEYLRPRLFSISFGISHRSNPQS